MRDALLYRHEFSGRSPLAWVLLLAGVAMTALGLWGGAPWLWFVPVGGALVGALWMVVANPRSGCRLTGDSLVVIDGRREREVPLATIAAMRVQRWVDGPDEIELLLHTGERIAVSGQSGGPGLAAALESVGIARRDRLSGEEQHRDQGAKEPE